MFFNINTAIWAWLNCVCGQCTSWPLTPKAWLLISTSLSPTISNVGKQLWSLCARTPRNTARYFPRRGRNVTLALFANAILLKLCSSHLVVLYQWPPSLRSPQKTNPISNRSKWQAVRTNPQNMTMCDADKVGQNLLKMSITWCQPGQNIPQTKSETNLISCKTSSKLLLTIFFLLYNGRKSLGHTRLFKFFQIHKHTRKSVTIVTTKITKGNKIRRLRYYESRISFRTYAQQICRRASLEEE